MFVREPIAATVKTRLVPALGAAGAALLYRAFVEDVCARLAPHVPLALAYASATGADGFVATLARRYGWPTFAHRCPTSFAACRGAATASSRAPSRACAARVSCRRCCRAGTTSTRRRTSVCWRAISTCSRCSARSRVRVRGGCSRACGRGAQERDDAARRAQERDDAARRGDGDALRRRD